MDARQQGDERRATVRYFLPYPVKLASLDKKEEVEPAFCENISKGGMRLLSQRQCSVGEKLLITFSYEYQNKAVKAEFKALVVWSRSYHQESIPQKWQCGVQFFDKSEAEEEHLQELIDIFCVGKKTEDLKDEKDARSYFILGIQKFESDLDCAIEAFSRAIELEPTHVAAYYYRAFARDRKGDIKGAESDFKKAQELGGI